jgi:hypothetical protein
MVCCLPFLSLIPLFPVAVISHWDYTGETRTQRISHSDDCTHSEWFCTPADLRVTGCSFHDISTDGNGGAVYFWSYGDFRVSSSLFVRCSSTAAGGAVWADTEWFDILGSCAVSCSAGVDGSVVYCGPDDGNNDFFDDSFVNDFASRDGTICADDDQPFHFARINFTSCEAVNSGSAFVMRDSSLTFDATNLILLSLRGRSGIESRCGSVRTLSLSNIYDNSMTTSGSVLWSQTHGLSVSQCIFRDNVDNLLIGMTNIPSSSNRFTFSDCVFSDEYPSDTRLSSIGSNSCCGRYCGLSDQLSDVN